MTKEGLIEKYEEVLNYFNIEINSSKYHPGIMAEMESARDMVKEFLDDLLSLE